MKAKEIIAECVTNLQDSSFTPADLLAYINSGCGQLASVYCIPGLLVTKDIVVPASTPIFDAPADFLRSIFHASNVTTKREIEVFDEFAYFVERFPLFDEVGDIDNLTYFGSSFYVQGAPLVEQTIRVMYYASPKTLVESSEPNFLPKHLHYDLLVNFVLSEAWNTIEDGIDGTKVNANKFASRFQLACLKLEAFIGLPLAKPQYIPADERFDDGLDGI